MVRCNCIEFGLPPKKEVGEFGVYELRIGVARESGLYGLNVYAFRWGRGGMRWRTEKGGG
jgi:hypothetical protein